MTAALSSIARGVNRSKVRKLLTITLCVAVDMIVFNFVGIIPFRRCFTDVAELPLFAELPLLPVGQLAPFHLLLLPALLDSFRTHLHILSYTEFPLLS